MNKRKRRYTGKWQIETQGFEKLGVLTSLKFVEQAGRLETQVTLVLKS